MKVKPVLLPCPRCGEPRAEINLRLYALGGEEYHEARCVGCGCGFDLAEVLESPEWRPVLAWIEQVPQPDPVAPADCSAGHDRCFNTTLVYTSNPPQMDWGCRRCGARGRDRVGEPIGGESEYDRLTTEPTP